MFKVDKKLRLWLKWRSRYSASTSGVEGSSGEAAFVAEPQVAAKHVESGGVTHVPLNVRRGVLLGRARARVGDTCVRSPRACAFRVLASRSVRRWVRLTPRSPA
jgi:hypothetical protein